MWRKPAVSSAFKKLACNQGLCIPVLGGKRLTRFEFMVRFTEPQTSLLLSVNVFVAELLIYKVELVIAFLKSRLDIKLTVCSSQVVQKYCIWNSRN